MLMFPLLFPKHFHDNEKRLLSKAFGGSIGGPIPNKELLRIIGTTKKLEMRSLRNAYPSYEERHPTGCPHMLGCQRGTRAPRKSQSPTGGCLSSMLKLENPKESVVYY